MTIADFRKMIDNMASERMGLAAYSEYLKQNRKADKSNPDKYLREEYLPLLAVFNEKKIADTEEIELGDERETWDARISNTDLFEVVQALPKNEHEVRQGIASGGTTPFAYFQHSDDHHQFPMAIVNAIQSKHDKNYPEERTLIVVVDGDYSFEDDRIIEAWIDEVRLKSELGNFSEILLVERSRFKVFPIF